MKHEIRKINNAIVISGPHGGEWSIERGNEQIIVRALAGFSENIILQEDNFCRLWDGVERSNMEISGDGTDTITIVGDITSFDVVEQWHLYDGPPHPPKKHI